MRCKNKNSAAVCRLGARAAPYVLGIIRFEFRRGPFLGRRSDIGGRRLWRDADRIAELFLPDAILVLPTGSVTRSRSEIRQRVLAEWRGKLKDSQLSYAVEDVSLLNNDTAVVTRKYRLSGVKILGFDQAPEGPFIFRHKKQRGRWMISKAEILGHKAK